MSAELLTESGIIIQMRKMAVILMIALLAVRGWAGAVMSVEMSVQSLATVPSMAAMVHIAGPAGAEMSVLDKADCLDHAAMPTAGDAVADASSHCNTCVACQICHTVALAGITPLKLAPFGDYSPITPGGTRFASAALPNGFKPPIS